MNQIIERYVKAKGISIPEHSNGAGSSAAHDVIKITNHRSAVIFLILQFDLINVVVYFVTIIGASAERVGSNEKWDTESWA